MVSFPKVKFSIDCVYLVAELFHNQVQSISQVAKTNNNDEDEK